MTDKMTLYSPDAFKELKKLNSEILLIVKYFYITFQSKTELINFSE